jgi:hypothetical protein
MPLTDSFQYPLSNCRQIQNAGISLYVSRLAACASEPLVYTLVLNGATVVNDTAVDFDGITPVPTATNPLFLRNGSRLYFGANFITIDGDQTITAATATNIAVRDVTAIVADNATTTTWGMKRILSPTNIPLTSNSNTVDRKDLTDGLQGSNVVTGKTLESAVQIITRVDDLAFWDVCFPASESGENIYAVIVRPETRMAFGQAQVSNSSVDGGINEIARDQFTLMYQAPYAYTSTYTRSTAVQKTAMNATASLTGLPLFV